MIISFFFPKGRAPKRRQTGGVEGGSPRQHLEKRGAFLKLNAGRLPSRVLVMKIFSTPWLWTRSPLLRRWSLLCLSAIECSFCTGVMFGASSLFAIMRKDGQYSELCVEPPTKDYDDNNNNTTNTNTNAMATCASANVKYSQIYTIGAFGTPISVLIWGILLDKFGVLPCRLASLAIFATGCVLLAESDSERFDAYIGASGLVSVGGAGFSLTHYAFCTHWESTRYFEVSHAIMNTSYDASTICFMIFMLLHQYDAETFSMRHLFYSLFTLSVLFLVLSHKWIWGKYMERAEVVTELEGRQLKYTMSLKSLGFSSANYFDLRVGGNAAIYNGKYINRMTFLEQMKTPHYLWLALWSFISIYRIMFFLGSIFEHLVFAGAGRDAEDANALVILFNGLILISILGFAMTGLFMKRFGLAISIAVVNVLGIISIIPVLFNDSYWSLCISFISFGIFRSMFYTTITLYCQNVFGAGTFGKMYGTGVGIWAILSAVLQYPTMNSALKSESPKKAFFYIDLSLVVCGVLLFIMPIWLHLTMKGNEHNYPSRSLATDVSGSEISCETTETTTTN